MVDPHTPKVKPNLMFNYTRRKVVLHGKATGSNVKGVPRQLTCFAVRLYISVSEEELTDFFEKIKVYLMLSV